MSSFNSKIKIDRAVGAAENISTGEEKMPWHLRFAPGAILALAVTVTVLTTIKANPVVGAIKYGAIPFGTWLVSAIGEGLVGKALSDYLAQAEGQKAYATVHGSRWLSMSTRIK